MAVIDVDLHFDVAVSPEEHPLRHLRGFLPSDDEFTACAIAGDLASVTPAEDVPPDEVLAAFIPEQNRSSSRYATMSPPEEPAFPSFTVADRLDWFERAGIDFALVNPGAVGIMACFLDDAHRAEAMQLSNDFLVERLDERTDRFAPVTLVD